MGLGLISESIGRTAALTESPLARVPKRPVAAMVMEFEQTSTLPEDLYEIFRALRNFKTLVEALRIIDGEERRAYAYQMVVERVLAGKELVCFEQELLQALLRTLILADVMIAQTAKVIADQQYRNRFDFYDASSVVTPADRIGMVKRA